MTNLPYNIEQIRTRLTPIFLRNNVRKAILFGSYCKGAATSASDVDIWVDSGLQGIQFFGLLEEICAALACSVDLIDAQDVVPGSRIDQEIHSTGIVIFEQNQTAHQEMP